MLHGEQTDGVYTIYWDICASGRLPTKHAGIDLDEQSSDREQNGVVPVCEIHRQGPHRFEVGTVMVIHTVNPPTRKAMKERGTICRDIHPTTEQTVLGVQMVWRRDRRSCATPGKRLEENFGKPLWIFVRLRVFKKLGSRFRDPPG